MTVFPYIGLRHRPRCGLTW